MKSLLHRAFAKINFGLRILGKRKDGYHDIETIFHRIGLHDELRVEPAGELTIDCSDPTIPAGENLAFLAAARLRERYGVTAGARLTLRKRIPSGAGLGGGSADAAGTLLLLCRLWGLTPAGSDLREIALGLGSDVPYFLSAGSALATSRGERLEYFDLPLPYAILLAIPPFGVSTREAYASVTPGNHQDSDDLKTLLLQHLHPPELLRNVLVNDFEASVSRANPAIPELKREIYRAGADFASMSGSGSAVYGVFSDPTAAGNAALVLGRANFVHVTPPGFVADPGVGAAVD